MLFQRNLHCYVQASTVPLHHLQNHLAALVSLCAVKYTLLHNFVSTLSAVCRNGYLALRTIHEWNLSYTSGESNRFLYCDCLLAIPADDIKSVPSILRDKHIFTCDMIEALEVLDMKTQCEASHRLSTISSYTHYGQFFSAA
jgi:hypothetical protein